MNYEIEYWTTSKVQLIDSMGSDARIVEAAKVSTKGEESLGSEASKGFIKFLLGAEPAPHISPFEHCVATFLIETPLFVCSQVVRHKSFSYSVESGRYREFRPRFYLPPEDRPLKQVGKTGDYQFGQLEREDQEYSWYILEGSTEVVWSSYKHLLASGVAKEVARMVLPQNTITSLYMTGNLRNWMFFLQSRLDHHAQFEIREVAARIEEELDLLFPTTMGVARELVLF